MIGVGITTRNRPECLETSLRHFQRFGYGDKIVVIDDNSELWRVNKTVIDNSCVDVKYKLSNTRLGIAKAKNACLAELQDCDHVFLFDDDAWPMADGWAQRWIDINKYNSIGHSMFGVDCDANEDVNKAFRAHIKEVARIGDFDHQMIAMSNCFGVLLYFNRECLDAIGGYDHSAQNVYGYEHAQVSERAGKAGFTKGHKYICPAVSMELIYSVDLTYNWLKLEPPLPAEWLAIAKSSVTQDEADGHKKNSTIMDNLQIKIDLVDPFSLQV